MGGACPTQRIIQDGMWIDRLFVYSYYDELKN